MVERRGGLRQGFLLLSMRRVCSIVKSNGKPLFSGIRRCGDRGGERISITAKIVNYKLYNFMILLMVYTIFGIISLIVLDNYKFSRTSIHTYIYMPLVDSKLISLQFLMIEICKQRKRNDICIELTRKPFIFQAKNETSFASSGHDRISSLLFFENIF